MIRWLETLLPDRFAARFAALLALALIAANLVAVALFSVDRQRGNREADQLRAAERVIALVQALDAVAPDQRPAIAREATNRFTDVRIAGMPVIAVTGPDQRSAALAAQLAEALPDRAVFADTDSTVSLHGHDDPGDARHGGPGGSTTAIAIALKDAEPPAWLNIVSRDGGGGRQPGLPMSVLLIVLGLSLVSALAAGLVATRQMTRPLARLAEAARAAGRGDRSARVPVTGAREMREAAAAFNAMQTEIARFDAERMRTLAAVGHDLRTPITSLRIRAEMLEEETARDAMIRTLDDMGVMAEGLVAYAKGSREAEDSQGIDLAAFLTRLCEDRGATLKVESGVTIVGRPVALSRAFGNLIDNALRYGGVARVSLHREKSEAVITITDDGPGIAPERLDTVFEPFVRGEDSRNLETGGAGLGLSICRSIIRAHGGTVRLENAAPKGLRAVVRLPIA